VLRESMTERSMPNYTNIAQTPVEARTSLSRRSRGACLRASLRVWSSGQAESRLVAGFGRKPRLAYLRPRVPITSCAGSAFIPTTSRPSHSRALGSGCGVIRTWAVDVSRLSIPNCPIFVRTRAPACPTDELAAQTTDADPDGIPSNRCNL